MMTFEEWNSTLRATCGHYYGEPGTAPTAPSASFALHSRHGVDVADIRCSINRIHRDRAGIRRDDAEHLFLLVQQSGQTRVTHSSHVETLGPGDCLLLDSTAPADLDYGCQSVRFLSAHLPRAQCLEGRRAAFATGRKIAANHPLAPNFHRLLSSDGWAAPGESGLGFLSDLVALAFGGADNNDATRIRDRKGRFAFVTSVIDRNLTNPDLSIDGVAAQVHMSRRQLQRDFRDNGTSFSAYLQCQRLKYVAEHLRAAARLDQSPSISDLAYGAGFGDISHFNRSFRARYGLAPRDFLQDTAMRLQPH